ncbi:MAG: tRNA pseudouridine(13) synthase TruD [Candidatus Bathyarchaeia archaeon]
MFVSKLDKSIGIEVYATSSLGIGGVIRHFAEDFIVKELLVDGSRAEIDMLNSFKYGMLNSNVNKPYLLCVLIKRNWDTFLALKAIAEELGINLKCIQIAGIKDAKAVTAQHITVQGISAEEIQRIQIKDIKIRPIGFFHSELSPYYLLGNNFRITIRAINHTKSETNERLERTVEELKAIGGIPNFFGHQRFGTIRPITHMVGKAIVKRKFKKAAMLFLAKPSLNEHPESKKYREKLYKTQDFKQALKDFPRQLRYERLMLMHLAEKPNDFIGAFKRLPLKLQMLFPQAYQAYLFNKFLSRRIQMKIPLNRAEVGDYVVNVEISGLPMTTMHRITSLHNLNEINEAVKSGRMRMAIPMVGFKQHTSQGIQGEIEKQILDEEGIAPEDFKIKEMPEISARGGLRTAITPLNNFEVNQILDDDAFPSKRKVELSFMLHRGSYATILLRELMKPINPIRAGF